MAAIESRLQPLINIGEVCTHAYYNKYRDEAFPAFNTAYKLLATNNLASENPNRYLGSSPLNDTTQRYEVVALTDGRLQGLKEQEPVNYYLCNKKGETTITLQANIGDTILTVASTTGAVVGECINIQYNKRYYQGLITNITGLNISVTPSFDFDIDLGAIVCFGDFNMNVDGSQNEVIFKIQPPIGTTWDITTITFAIVDNVVMDDAKFGGIAALSNGILLRRVDGTIKNYWLINNNSGFKQRAYNTEYSDKAPSGFYGFSGLKDVLTLNATSIRLFGDTQDELQLVVRDNLTELTEFVMVAIGHVVSN